MSGESPIDIKAHDRFHWVIRGNPESIVSNEMMDTLERVLFNHQHPPIILYGDIVYVRIPEPYWNEPVAGVIIK